MISMETTITIKPKQRWNNEGIAPILGAVILIVGAAIAAGVVIAAYQLTVKPDVVYNITDTGFSLAGVDTGVIYAIAGAGILIGLLWFASRKK